MFIDRRLGLLWLTFFPVNLFFSLLGYVLAPLVALPWFVRQELRTDKAKVLGPGEFTLLRDQLVTPLYWFQTHDNAVDEYWYGGYALESLFPPLRAATQRDYDASPRLRYVCRLFWLWRNCAYGFSYNLLGRALIQREVVTEVGDKDKGRWTRYTDRGNSFQYRAHRPLVWRIYADINIGWKTHDGFPRAMYANRFFSLRLFEQ